MKYNLFLITFILSSVISFAQKSSNIYNIELDFSSCFVGNVEEKIYATYDPYWSDDKSHMATFLIYGCNQYAKKQTNDIILGRDNSYDKTIKFQILSVDAKGSVVAKMAIYDKDGKMIYSHPDNLNGDGDSGLRDECNIHKPYFPNDYSEALFKAMCDIGDAVKDILTKLNKK